MIFRHQQPTSRLWLVKLSWLAIVPSKAIPIGRLNRFANHHVSSNPSLRSRSVGRGTSSQSPCRLSRIGRLAGAPIHFYTDSNNWKRKPRTNWWVAVAPKESGMKERILGLVVTAVAIGIIALAVVIAGNMD